MSTDTSPDASPNHAFSVSNQTDMPCNILIDNGFETSMNTTVN